MTGGISILPTLYHGIINILAVMPFVTMGIIYYFARNIKWHSRYPLMIIVGWISFVVFVLILNYFAYKYAPTKELMETAVNGDGAANAFAVVFGWLYALIVLLLMEFVRKMIFYLKRYLLKW